MSQEELLTTFAMVVGAVAAIYAVQWYIKYYKKRRRKASARRWAEVKAKEKHDAFLVAQKLEKNILPIGQIPYEISKEIGNLARLLMALGGKPVIEHTFVHKDATKEEVLRLRKNVIAFLQAESEDSLEKLWENNGIELHYPPNDRNYFARLADDANTASYQCRDDEDIFLRLTNWERIQLVRRGKGSRENRTIVVFGWSKYLASIRC